MACMGRQYSGAARPAEGRTLEHVVGGLSPALVATLHIPLPPIISDTAGSADEAVNPTIIAIMAKTAPATVQWRP